MLLLDDLLTLGFDALHPLEPGPMDIEAVKRDYGDRLCLVGNIDLHYTLTLGTPEEVDAEVKQRIETIGMGGGYMISSANSITSYCKIENVRAMIEAIRKYGAY
jgi:uroporphyrinogen decarboxylase